MKKKVVSKAAQSTAKKATALRTLQLPEIGARWRGQGGEFVGIGRRQGETRDHVVILAPLEKVSGNWQKCLDYAKKLKIDGHTDFEAAQPEDGHLCQANLWHLFEKRAYWLGKQYAGDERFAWYQTFNYGCQYSSRKNEELRLFAVRRFAI